MKILKTKAEIKKLRAKEQEKNILKTWKINEFL